MDKRMKVYICPICGTKIISMDFKTCHNCLYEIIPLATPQEDSNAEPVKAKVS